MKPQIGETWKWSNGEPNTTDLTDYFVFISKEYAYIFTLEAFGGNIDKIRLRGYVDEWIKNACYKKI